MNGRVSQLFNGGGEGADAAFDNVGVLPLDDEETGFRLIVVCGRLLGLLLLLGLGPEGSVFWSGMALCGGT